MHLTEQHVNREQRACTDSLGVYKVILYTGFRSCAIAGQVDSGSSAAHCSHSRSPELRIGATSVHDHG